jgi:hypothetical protein
LNTSTRSPRSVDIENRKSNNTGVLADPDLPTKHVLHDEKVEIQKSDRIDAIATIDRIDIENRKTNLTGVLADPDLPIKHVLHG